MSAGILALLMEIWELIKPFVFFAGFLFGAVGLFKTMIFDEVIKKNRNQYMELLEFSFTEPHDWICVNTKSRKIYKKFDEIVFN
jgi:hypothetical protein